MSSSIMKTLQIRKPASLPVSSTDEQRGLLRRRLSSLSRTQPSTTTTDGDFPRSKSVSSMKEWWEWSWSLILLKKLPIFITDLQLNMNEASLLTKFRSGIRRLLRPSSSDSLPLSFKHGQR